MKKNTSKKAKTKAPSRSKSAPKKSSLSIKSKKSASSRPAKAAAPARKIALAVPQKRKPVGMSSRPNVATSAKSTPAQKSDSENGRQPTVVVPKIAPPLKQQKSIPPAANNGEQKKAPPPPAPPAVKTYLSNKELREFKALLLAKRAELAGDVENLTSQALNRKSSGVSDQSSMPIHMADLGSDTWEQDFTLGLIANEQAVVREIDEALVRIEDRTYGICVATDKPISKERLLAKPWAKYCIEYARLREEGRAP